MSSDSEDAEQRPTDSVLEQALRDAVYSAYKAGNLEELTVNKARSVAEKQLKIQDGFFKHDSTWKEKSKQIISNTVVSVSAYAVRHVNSRA